MTPKHEQPASISPSQLQNGEIVALEAGRVCIRLESGVIGFLTGISKEEIQSTFKLGQRGMFQIERCDENGETLVSRAATSEVRPSFDHEVNRLHEALNQHHSTPVKRDEIMPVMDEQHIRQWIEQVDTSLEKLKRNRAKRMDEEFYSET